MSLSINRRALLKSLFAASAVAMLPFSATLAEAAVSGTAVAAAKEALRGNFTDAGTLAAQSGDQAAIKLVELIYLRDHGKDVGFQRIRDFQAAAAKWPLSETMSKRAEQALFQSVEDPNRVIDYFKDHAALTAEGHAALARAYFSLGQDDEGKK